MARTLVGVLMILLSYSVNADEPSQIGTPMSKEQIAILEAQLKGLEAVNEMENLLEAMSTAKNFACLKAFGLSFL